MSSFWKFTLTSLQLLLFVESLFILPTSLFHSAAQNTVIFSAIATCIMIPAKVKSLESFDFINLLAKKKLSKNSSQSWMQEQNKLIKDTDSKY